MQGSNNRDFKGIWISKEIWNNENLSITQKVFIAEIDSLDGENGCFASNEYFSNFFKLSKGRISKIISELVNSDIISIELIYDGKEVKKRILRIVKNNHTLWSKTTTTYGRKRLPPMVENSEDITKNNNKEYNKEIEEEKHTLSFSDLKNKISIFLKERKKEYIYDIRKESNALHEFAMNSISEKEIFKLFEKLISIKNHPKYINDTFWRQATINLSGIKSYRTQILTVYSGLFGNAMQTKSEIIIPKDLRSFQVWIKKYASPDTVNDLNSLSFTQIDKTLKIHCTDNLWRFIAKYFEGTDFDVIRVNK